jgi:hypothetical protein
MARRPDHPSKEQLTEAQLSELRTRLEKMDLHELTIFYKASHNACQYSLRLPSARMVQELVATWKVLRKRL